MALDDCFEVIEKEREKYFDHLMVDIFLSKKAEIIKIYQKNLD